MKTERYTFNNLGDLRDWLNQFKATDLNVVLPGGEADFVTMHWETETLTDGSEVNNFRLNMNA